MSIAEQITRIQEAKNAIREAIVNKGGELTATQSISDYAVAIENLPETGDLPDVTVTADVLLEGATAIDSNGEVVTGTMPTVALEREGGMVFVNPGYTSGEAITIEDSERIIEANKLTITPGYVAETVTLEVPLAEIVADEKKVTVGIGYVDKEQEFVITKLEGAEVKYGYWSNGTVQVIDASTVPPANKVGENLSLTPYIFMTPPEKISPADVSVPLTFTAIDDADNAVGLILSVEGGSDDGQTNLTLPVFCVNDGPYSQFFTKTFMYQGEIKSGVDVSVGVKIRVKSAEEGTEQSEFSTENEYITFKTGTVRTDKNEYEKLLDGTLNASGNVMSLLGFASACSDYCFQHLFSGASLGTVPLLPAMALAKQCYAHMFKGAILGETPSLPAMALATECYRGMFWDAKLPAKILEPELHEKVLAPKLPAQVLAMGCYYNMFAGSNISSVEIDALVLAKDSCSQMFYGCKNLSSITVHFTAWIEGATENWVTDVAPTGIFYKPAELPEIYGENYIPAGWNVATI